MRYIATTVMAAATMTSSLVLAQPAAPPAMQSVSPQAGEEVSHMISRPKTPTEYARNLKFIFDHNLLLQDEFYVEANLKDIFNLEEVSIVDRVISGARYRYCGQPARFDISTDKGIRIFRWIGTECGLCWWQKESESGLTHSWYKFRHE